MAQRIPDHTKKFSFIGSLGTLGVHISKTIDFQANPSRAETSEAEFQSLLVFRALSYPIKKFEIRANQGLENQGFLIVVCRQEIIAKSIPDPKGSTYGEFSELVRFW